MLGFVNLQTLLDKKKVCSYYDRVYVVKLIKISLIILQLKFYKNRDMLGFVFLWLND